ncbi:hypothetical protein MBM_08101 [Drepanopeziza brunnea f. sp. 'multigermtubi' MB_m1]|uniref:Uncharacterized protein n=1 Tax=Marssonina brunnea f. sp. multigermtubi (strain MB_m1) TaxID=1072389 RepID=K1W9H3_MARBU|nr:uncharacterized protein MBM_08101 [Drepanopeziza brunnea f. sp. 'multigermtubi' MB_m1]EKD13900.1 hypothetical protein MBM_08101 [Drepanopeziza brunnea f. sp. 'multigermtubi' MB_m1]
MNVRTYNGPEKPRQQILRLGQCISRNLVRDLAKGTEEIELTRKERQLLEKYKADLHEGNRLGAIQSHKNWIISAIKLRRRLDSVQNSAETGVQRDPDTNVLVIIEILRRACRDRAKLLGPEADQPLEEEICAPSCSREARIQEIHRRIRNREAIELETVFRIFTRVTIPYRKAVMKELCFHPWYMNGDEEI